MLLREPIPGRVAGMRIVEDYAKRPGVLGAVKGVFSEVDVENKNGRVYERALWEHVLNEEKYRKALQDKTLLGEPDHPETRTQSAIREASHTVVEAALNDRGEFRGVVEVFDNPLGRMVWPILQAGVKLGFSTRGDGDLIEDSRSGKTRVDPNTYEWHGVDFVLNPSFVGAMPESISEAVKSRVRVALTEAVEEKKIQDGVREDVEALLESRVTEQEVVEQRVNWTLSGSSEEFRTPLELQAAAEAALEGRHIAVHPGRAYGSHQMMASDNEGSRNTLALESALGQLSQEKERALEISVKLREAAEKADVLETETEKLRGTHDGRKKELAEGQKRIGVLSREVKRLREELTEAGDDTEVRELRRVLKEGQSAHLRLVKAHRELQSRHQKTKNIITGLRDRVTEAESRAADASQKLKEREEGEPQKIKNATLEQYKKVKTEEAAVPDELMPLLERAETEEEVDALIETLQASQASRYDYLPMGRDSRRQREEILESVNEEETSEDVESDEITEDKRVIRSQLKR